jgi:putative RNA 2'-phosphotransferase
VEPTFDPTRLLQVLAYALRHNPRQFGVALDEEGFADLDELVIGIRFSNYDWALLDRPAVETALLTSSPDRFECRDGRIRTRYGHTIQLATPGDRVSPPEILFHGTPAAALAVIARDGLRPMNRAFVHLTASPDYADQVATSKGGGVVLRIRSREASDAGVEFFQANPRVWLVRELAHQFIDSVRPIRRGHPMNGHLAMTFVRNRVGVSDRSEQDGCHVLQWSGRTP